MHVRVNSHRLSVSDTTILHATQSTVASYAWLLKHFCCASAQAAGGGSDGNAAAVEEEADDEVRTHIALAVRWMFIDEYDDAYTASSMHSNAESCCQGQHAHALRVDTILMPVEQGVL